MGVNTLEPILGLCRATSTAITARTTCTFITPWPIQAVLWLEWGGWRVKLASRLEDWGGSTKPDKNHLYHFASTRWEALQRGCPPRLFKPKNGLNGPPSRADSSRYSCSLAGGPHNAVFVVWGIESFLAVFLTSTRFIPKSPLKPKNGLNGPPSWAPHFCWLEWSSGRVELASCLGD